MFAQFARKTVLFISGLFFSIWPGLFDPALAGEPDQSSRVELSGRSGAGSVQDKPNPDSLSSDGSAAQGVYDRSGKVMTPTGLQTSASQLSVAKPLAADLPVKYWGNSFSLKFHRPSCPFAKAMSAHHVMFFNFRKDAVDSGQVPCRYCLPPSWTSVHAALWHSAELKAKTESP